MGCDSGTSPDPVDEGLPLRGRGLSAPQPSGEVGILFVEQAFESALLLDTDAGIFGIQEPEQNYVQFLGAPAAAPAQSGWNLQGRRYRRSASIFLISAMDLPGFRFLGQVLVQFMMVWQR